MWIFQKVSLLCYSVIILKRLNSALGALIGLLKLLVVIESYDVHFWVEELSNFTYKLHGATTARAGRVFRARVGKFGCKKCVMQYTRFLHPNAGAKLDSP